jgi:hypothetical protein
MLAYSIHADSLRTHADAKRRALGGPGLALPSAGGACPQQYVEELNGETAHHNRIFTLAAEAS